MIRNIIFDMGHVLMWYRPQEACRRLLKKQGRRAGALRGVLRRARLGGGRPRTAGRRQLYQCGQGAASKPAARRRGYDVQRDAREHPDPGGRHGRGRGRCAEPGISGVPSVKRRQVHEPAAGRDPAHRTLPRGDVLRGRGYCQTRPPPVRAAGNPLRAETRGVFSLSKTGTTTCRPPLRAAGIYTRFTGDIGALQSELDAL